MNKYMKKYLTVLLVVAIFAGLIPSAFSAAPSDNFEKQRDYDNRYTDVKTTDWFYGSVKLSYEYDLINGVSATSFAPKSNLSIAAILALASRLHSISANGQASFVESSPWYQVYVDYARENGFLLSGLDSYTRNARRDEVAAILVKALPGSSFAPINTVEDDAIPDVKMNAPYASEIYMLYRAGILTGGDNFGTFQPNTSIKRSEIATILARIISPELREARTFKKLEKLYIAFFEVDSTLGTINSIIGVTVRFYGHVSAIDPVDFTDFVLTRDGVKIDNPVVMNKSITQTEWGSEKVTDVYFEFKQTITEPGRYGFTGRYGATPFTVTDKVIEAPGKNKPADPDKFQSSQFSHTYGPKGGLESIVGVTFTFAGQHEDFSISDLTNLKLTRDGSEIKFSLTPEVFRYLGVEFAGMTTTFALVFTDDGFIAPGTYKLTGEYRGRTFSTYSATLA